jgi:predicted sulfurtransferase
MKRKRAFSEGEGEPSRDRERVATLRKRLEKAIEKGKGGKAERVKVKLELLETAMLAAAAEELGPSAENERAAKLRLRLERARARGDEDKARRVQAKLTALRSADMAGAAAAGAAAGEEDVHEKAVVAAVTEGAKTYPPPKPGNVTILLFYAYVQPPWTHRARAEAVHFTHRVLTEHGCGGRLRVALEGFNGTLSGTAAGIRAFTDALREYSPEHFGAIDFKYVDGLQDNKAFKGLKVWPVEELVTYGFDVAQAPLGMGGTHVKPDVFTAMASDPEAVLIDVRNANETAIGYFEPPVGGATPLDPRMRRSTEFPDWVDANMELLKSKKKILMCCTAGIRCERASALLGQKGLTNIFQLEGGIHRYLDAYPADGGIWAGKNYTFDKRFSHGAASAKVVSECCLCKAPWDRYQAQAKCSVCKMEVILCRECQRGGKAEAARKLCWLCEEGEAARKAGGVSSKAAAAAAAAARAFAAAGGGRDGEGEGKGAPDLFADFGGGGGRAGGTRR